MQDCAVISALTIHKGAPVTGRPFHSLSIGVSQLGVSRKHWEQRGSYRPAATMAMAGCRPFIMAANPGKSSDCGPSDSARSGQG